MKIYSIKTGIDNLLAYRLFDYKPKETSGPKGSTLEDSTILHGEYKNKDLTLILTRDNEVYLCSKKEINIAPLIKEIRSDLRYISKEMTQNLEEELAEPTAEELKKIEEENIDEEVKKDGKIIDQIAKSYKLKNKQ